MSEYSDMIRINFKKNDDVRDAGLTTPDYVKRFDNIAYGPDKDWQIMDLYRPKDADGQVLPVIVSYHGGGWVYGDKDLYQYYCMSLVQHGFAVVNFTYRLAPEFKFPAQLEDMNLVINWIFDNANEYGLDTDHIFGVGDSAGAHQLALYTAICTNEAYASKFPFKVTHGFKPTAVALNCGAYVLDTSDKERMDSALMADYLPNKGTKEEIEMICVPNHITEDFVPTLCMTASGDFLKAQAPILVSKLIENNVPNVFNFYGDKNTELGHVFHLNMKTDIAALCNKQQCDFFKKFI